MSIKELILLRHGASEVAVSDRGRSFTSRLMQEVMRLCHTSRRKTVACHLQTNGLTEGLNRIIAYILSTYVDVKQEAWCTIICYVTIVYNAVLQETTGFSRFRIVHSREATTSLNALLTHHTVGDNADDDAALIFQVSEEMRQLARRPLQPLRPNMGLDDAHPPSTAEREAALRTVQGDTHATPYEEIPARINIFFSFFSHTINDPVLSTKLNKLPAEVKSLMSLDTFSKHLEALFRAT